MSNTLEWVTAISAVCTTFATSALAYFAFTAFGSSVAQLKLLRADSERRPRTRPTRHGFLGRHH